MSVCSLVLQLVGVCNVLELQSSHHGLTAIIKEFFCGNLNALYYLILDCI